jgi:hypothetical protein
MLLLSFSVSKHDKRAKSKESTKLRCYFQFRRHFVLWLFFSSFFPSFFTIPSSHKCPLIIKEKDHSRHIRKGIKRINTIDNDEITMTDVTETLMTTTGDAAAKITTTQDQNIHDVITMMIGDDDVMMMKAAGVDINVWLLPLKVVLASCPVKATWTSK